MPRIQIKGGLKANLPTTGMLVRELHVTTDQGTMHVATDATTKLPVVPAIDDLSNIPTIDGAADLMMVYDSSESSGQKAKKVTPNAFKSWLAIPEGTTDEKVALTSSAQTGYLYGSDGTDGVLRNSASVVWSRTGADPFASLVVSVIDGGTF